MIFIFMFWNDSFPGYITKYVFLETEDKIHDNKRLYFDLLFRNTKFLEKYLYTFKISVIIEICRNYFNLKKKSNFVFISFVLTCEKI